ncbi:hypothetical protein [Paractinoplanes maris]|uniref:hypothetical protein n=1 Tax=Paractinoplanes maris TaxID=1734446 RepID=UPI002020C105|nr:hypothetical protein [Actinoplanes maris]
MDQPAPPRSRRRAVIIVLAVLVVAIAALLVYTLGVFDDKGRFRSEPPACATLEPSLPALAATYVPKQDGKNNCGLWLPETDPAYVKAPKITVAYAVLTPGRGDAPAAASKKLQEFAPLGFTALPGVGEEAYVWNTNLYFRVSNLLVGITVYPNPASSQSAVHAFAKDLAGRLTTS